MILARHIGWCCPGNWLCYEIAPRPSPESHKAVQSSTHHLLGIVIRARFLVPSLLSAVPWRVPFLLLFSICVVVQCYMQSTLIHLTTFFSFAVTVVKHCTLHLMTGNTSVGFARWSTWWTLGWQQCTHVIRAALCIGIQRRSPSRETKAKGTCC